MAPETAPRREIASHWFTPFPIEENAGDCKKSIANGLLDSLERFGKVDIGHIAKISQSLPVEVISNLGTAIWQNPETWADDPMLGWETADQYLSGALRPKLEAAKAAAIRRPALFQRNVKALEAVMPKPLAPDSIYMALGSAWIPANIINMFAISLFKPHGNAELVKYDGMYHISWPKNVRSSFRGTRAMFITYGSEKCCGLALLEKTLNRAPVKDMSLREKQQRLQNAFKRWLKGNAEVYDGLREIYDQKFGFIRKRVYDGSFLHFPGMTPDIELYPHQRNAVARILFNGNTLLAHEVGAGKTFTMIAAAMELKRLGRSDKNLFIVPNSILGQWKDAFKTLYPAANILIVSPVNFTPANRLDTMKEIATGNHDGIIMAFSCANRINVSPKFRSHLIDEEIGNLRSMYNNGKLGRNMYTRRQKMLEKGRKNLNKLLSVAERADFYFDELGITAMFLDEAHNYKNVPIETTLDHVRGINTKGSKKCADMLMRARHVQSTGGVVVLATGTPISNSITDVYNMQQFLQKGTLSLFGLDGFDAWAGTFAEPKEVLELDLDAERFHTVERLAQFHNLPELSAIFGMVTDFATTVTSSNFPECEKKEDICLPKSLSLANYMDTLSRRADMVRKRGISPKLDNLLKITTDGRKAALDMRLVDNAEPEDALCKAALCAENVIQIWKDYKYCNSAQLIFCDLSTPKKGFNVYEKLRNILIRGGLSKEEIAFVHEHNTPAEMDLLYQNVCHGKVRVLIGSTFKLGLGVNIQERLIALHHLDVPWRPADMGQREGRILREGNIHKNVRIFRYVTEGSFDSWCWQVLETKQRFIAGFLSGNMCMRNATDQDSITLSYAEIKALAAGDPLIRKRLECQTKIEQTMLLRKARETELENMRMEVVNCQQKEEELTEKMEILARDIAIAEKHPRPDAETRKRMEIFLATEMQMNGVLEGDRVLGKYRGFSLVIPDLQPKQKPGLWLRAHLAEPDIYLPKIMKLQKELVKIDWELE